MHPELCHTRETPSLYLGEQPLGLVLPKPKLTPEAERTLEYYERNAADFAARTEALNAEACYIPFLEHIPAGGHILDAGCGVGRDAKRFMDRGYEVTVMDPSPAMLSEAAKFNPHHAIQAGFGELDRENEYDGIWAMASLLHVPKAETDDAFARCHKALKVEGAMFLGYKLGAGERTERDGRFFRYFGRDELVEYLKGLPDTEVVHFSMIENVGAVGRETSWAYAVIKKTA